MKTLRLVLACILVFVLRSGAQEVLTNDSVVKMVKGGLGEELILTMIRNQPGKYSTGADDLVKLKQQGVSDKVILAMVNKSGPAGREGVSQARQEQDRAAPKAAAPSGEASGGSQRGGSAANNTFFVTWRDPRENAFQVGVPKGWQISGGLVRVAQIETHFVIRLQSPDRRIEIFFDDPDLGGREVPDQLTQFGGLREGQTLQTPYGGHILLARYLPGALFAEQYIRGKLCRQASITDAAEVQDATAQMNALAQPLARQAGWIAQASVGEAQYRCGAGVQGYVLANTFEYRAAAGRTATYWSIYQLGGYQVSDAQQEGLAYYVFHTLLETLKANPQWEAALTQQVQGVSASVNKMEEGMSQSIAKYGQRQASAASAGGFNHPNSGQLPTDLRKKWAIEGKSLQKYSDATMGQTWVHSSDGTNVRVDNSSTNWWRDNSGNVVRGPESGGPPPGSQGQYEKLQPGWQ